MSHFRTPIIKEFDIHPCHIIYNTYKNQLHNSLGRDTWKIY